MSSYSRDTYINNVDYYIYKEKDATYIVTAGWYSKNDIGAEGIKPIDYHEFAISVEDNMYSAMGRLYSHLSHLSCDYEDDDKYRPTILDTLEDDAGFIAYVKGESTIDYCKILIIRKPE